MVETDKLCLDRRAVIASLLASGFIMPEFASAESLSLKARVFVSLADSVNQGIGDVPKALGNGQDARNNLYWGALYGVKTYFNRSSNWNVRSVQPASSNVLDAIVISPKYNPEIQIHAEAWDGAHQRKTVRALYRTLANPDDENSLVVFVGHNALMDVFAPVLPITAPIVNANKARNRKAAVLACNSADYFSDFIRTAGVENYVMTHGLMAPEAYVLEGVFTAWMAGLGANVARENAAKQYSKYQKIPLRNSQRLFGK